MTRWTAMTAIGLALIGASSNERAAGQQVQVSAPFQRLHEGFYENFGFGGITAGRSGRGGGWHLNTGPAGMAPPPFGGHDPAADARFGMRFGGPLGLGFNGVAGQGMTRSNTVTVPTVVVPNGGTGYIFDGSLRPFVTGIVPVVGSAPVGPMLPMAPQAPFSPLAERLSRLPQQSPAAPSAHRAQVAPVPHPAADDAPLVLGANQAQAARAAAAQPIAPRPRAVADSTANHGDLSVAEIRRQQAVEDAARIDEIQVRIEKARGFEEAGKPGLAKIYYQQAATRADGELKQQLLAKIQALD